MKKTTNKTDKKTGRKRGQNGRFQPGNPGGPGRGKKGKIEEEVERLPFDRLIEKVVRDGMESTDLKRQVACARLGVLWEKMRGPTGREAVLEPWIMDLMNLLQTLTDALVEPATVKDTIKTMCHVCPSCDRLGERNPEIVDIISPDEDGDLDEEWKKELDDQGEVT
jgi:hypothetical protein